MAQRLRIFISSPNDVPGERLRADLIVDKLSQDYGRFFSIESYRWEHEAMLASVHFQDAIEPPSAFDIVVLILWSRLGTPLPEKTAQREYRGIDGRAPVTGTEWEYEEALKVAREKKAPDLLAFRNISPAPIDPRDPDAQAKSIAQLSALNAFWTRHFVDRGVFLAAYDEYRTLEEFAQRLEESLRKLIERRIKHMAGASSLTQPIWLGDPFRGLESYEFEHAPILFGRDAAVMKATEQLAANARSGHAFLLVSGASGSGKSSLVKAGVVPRLMKPQRISGIAFLRRAVFRPAAEDADVILGLAKALTRPIENSDVGLPELIGPGQDAGQLATHLRGAVGDPSYPFVHALGHLTETGHASGRLLAFESAKLFLVVDQLEELFTSPGIGPEDRRLFIKLLGGLARSGAVWVIATLRADFWHRGAEVSELISLAEGQGRIDLAAASPAELAEMIRKPAHAAGLSFEVHLETGLGLDAVLAEHAASAPGALPLLSFTLDELYKNAKARGEAVLTHASYEALGGLEGAIAKRADEIVAGLPTAAQVALPRVLRALTTVTGPADQVPVGRSAPLESFADGSPARILVDAFIAARLLVAASDGDAPPTVRLAHEALISRWQRARDQLAADRRDLETRTNVERQLARWSQAKGRARGLLLLRNPDLANAIDLARRWGDELDSPTHHFIQQSARRARFMQTLSVAAAVVFALIAVAAFFTERQAVRAQQEAENQRQLADDQQRQAEQQRAEAQSEKRTADQQRNQALLTQSRFLADLASQRNLAGDHGTAMDLAIEALPDSQSAEQRPYSPEAERALISALQSLFENAPLEGHTDKVNSATFSPDSTRVVTASADRTARIWDVSTGKQIGVLDGHEGPINSVAFSADGLRMVTVSDDTTMRVWDAKEGKQLASFDLGALGESAAFSPDGRIIAAITSTGKGQFADLFDVVSGKEIGNLDSPGKVFSISFSPDSRLVATATSDKTAQIWDAASGKKLAVLKGHTEAVNSAVFSPDGRRILTASDDGTARIWEATSGKQIKVFKSDEDLRFNKAVFSPDGQRILIIAGDQSGIWDVANGKEVVNLNQCSVLDASFTPKAGGVLVVCDDSTVRILSAKNGDEAEVFRGHQGPVTSAVISPDGQHVATASDDRTVRLWDTFPSKDITPLRGHQDRVNSAVFSPNNSHIITASDDKTARLWDTASGKQLEVLQGHESTVWSAAFSPDGNRAVTASYDNTVRLWNLTAAQQTAVLKGHVKEVWGAAFSPDGRLILSWSEDKTARIWDPSNGQQVATLTGHADSVGVAVFSPDSKYVVTGSNDNTARIWDAMSGKQLAVLQHDGFVNSVKFSHDGKYVLTASYDHTARLWDAENGKQLTAFEGHANVVNSAAFSPDGREVVTASDDNTARIWDTQSGKELFILKGHTNEVRGAAFSADGRRIVTYSYDGSVRLWDAKTGVNVAILRGFDAGVETASFSNDGRRIVATWHPSSSEHVVPVWRTFPTTTELVDYAKAVVPRCLTPKQRQDAFLDATPPTWCIDMAKWPYDTAEWKQWLSDARAGKNPPLPAADRDTGGATQN